MIEPIPQWLDAIVTTIIVLVGAINGLPAWALILIGAANLWGFYAGTAGYRK